MYNKKPEFIDPDEKNLTYFYNRTKEKKALEKKEDDCGGCDKRFFFGFKGKSARFPLLIFMYAGMIFALFFFAQKKLSQKTDPSIKESGGIQYILSAYPSQDKKKIVIQVLFLNKEKKLHSLSIQKIEAQFYSDKDKSLGLVNFPSQTISIEPEGLKNISLEAAPQVIPKSIKVILLFQDSEQILLEKEF